MNGKRVRKVNHKDMRRKATNLMAAALACLFTGAAAIECIPLGTALIFTGAFLGYRGNEIEKELR